LFVLDLRRKTSGIPDKLKITTISKAVRITSDALLAIQNKIDVFFLNDFGHPKAECGVQYGL
jgi:hypothetical protein